MILQEQCKQLGEWFNDTYPEYGLDITYRYNATDRQEEYFLSLEGPKLKRKTVGILIKDEWKENNEFFIEQARAKFVPANQRAIKQIIDGLRNSELLAELEASSSTYELRAPMEELFEKRKEIIEFTEEYDAKNENKKNVQ